MLRMCTSVLITTIGEVGVTRTRRLIPTASMLRRPATRRDRRRDRVVVGVVVREDRLRRVEVLAVDARRRRVPGTCSCRAATRVGRRRVLVEHVDVRAGLQREVRVQLGRARLRVGEVRVERHVVRRRPTRTRRRSADGATAVRRSLVMRSAIVCASPSAVNRSVVSIAPRCIDDDDAERGRDHDRQQRIAIIISMSV